MRACRARRDRAPGEGDPGHRRVRRHRGPRRRRVERARAWATSSSRTSARRTPSRMSCAASKTTTSSTSQARSIRSPTSRRSTPSSRSPTWRPSKSSSQKYEQAAKAGGDKEAQRIVAALKKVEAVLDRGRPARTADLYVEEQETLRPFFLLTMKPTMYVANVAERGFRDNPLLRAVEGHAAKESAPVVPVCAAIEAEIADLDGEDKLAFLSDLGLTEPGLDRVIHAGYKLLGLETYFTAGPKEVRAWTIHHRRDGAAGGGCHPHRLRERVHPRRGHRFRRLRRVQGRARREGARQDAARGARSTSSRTAT